MGDQPAYKLCVNKKTGELQVLPQKHERSDGVEQKLNTIIEQQRQSKYFTMTLLLAFLFAFVVVAIAVNDIRFCVSLIGMTIAAILGYIAVNYIDHMNIKYIMDTIRKMVNKQVDKDLQEKEEWDGKETKKNKNI